MTKRKMEVGSKVKHKEHGNGLIVVVHERTGQCNTHFANGALCVCPNVRFEISIDCKNAQILIDRK